MIRVDIRDLIIVMVAFVCFIAAADDRDPVDGGTIIVQNDRTGKCGYMPPGVGAEGKAEYKREIQLLRQKMQIAQGQYNIGFLMAGDIVGNKIIVPEIFFCLLELDGRKGTFRGGA